MNFIAVAFTIKETNELFLTVVQALYYEEALCKAITKYGLCVPSHEIYNLSIEYYSFHETMNYIQYCKMVCDISELEFTQLKIEVKY